MRASAPRSGSGRRSRPSEPASQFEAETKSGPTNTSAEFEAASSAEDLRSTVSSTGLSDSPSETDEIGFKPYVRAAARFLCDPNTRPPLTMSVEGRWGSGKSSFLLQLAAEIRQSQPVAGNNRLLSYLSCQFDSCAI
jgi:hypothetical protein